MIGINGSDRSTSRETENRLDSSVLTNPDDIQRSSGSNGGLRNRDFDPQTPLRVRDGAWRGALVKYRSLCVGYASPLRVRERVSPRSAGAPRKHRAVQLDAGATLTLAI